MRCFSKLIKQKSLYNLFLFLALLNIFFSTENSVAKTFSIKEIEISSPFNASFDKNKIINRGFVEAYEELIFTIAQSKDQKKLQNSSTKEVKSLVETFSIVQESFIDEIYNLTLNVEFNKKSFFELLEKKNVFPSSIIEKDLLSIFEKNRIVKIEAKGKKFDPNLHQAMTEIEDEKSDEGTVVQVIQSGYMMGERLLRPALVGVAKRKNSKNKEKEEKKG